MKITYLELRNFANIFAAMKRKTLVIDFKNSINRIVLLVGDNGSGKTSILSELHPFAYPGNMDIRNTASLIMENENGYKEVRIQHEDNQYIIKHHYMMNSGKGLKSFISKNGTEMNPNGNVTSFKEIVEGELGLQQDYLKLIRLGSNVTGFMDMKSTERKNFVSELLSDIDVYTKYYKKINDDSRLLKSLMKNVASKMEKLQIRSKDNEKEQLRFHESELERIKKEQSMWSQELGSIQGSIKTMVPEGIDELKKELSSLQRDGRGKHEKLNQLYAKQEKIVATLETYMGPISFLDQMADDKLVSLNKDVSEHEKTIHANNQMIEFLLTQLNTLNNKKKEKENDMRYFSSQEEYDATVSLYLKLNEEKARLDKVYKNYSTPYSKKTIISALSLMQDIENIISKIYEFDHQAVKKVVDYFLNKVDIDTTVRNKVNQIDTQIAQLTGHSSANEMRERVDKGPLYILIKPEDCNCECPFQTFYNRMTQPEQKVDKTSIQTQLQNLEIERERYVSMIDIAKNIEYIFVIIKSQRELVEGTPKEFFDITNILQCIKRGVLFYDEDKITNLISELDTYEEYLALADKIKEVHREKLFMEKSSGSLSTMSQELDAINVEINTIKKDLAVRKDENQHLEQLNSRIVTQIDNLMEFNKNKEACAELHKDITDIQNRDAVIGQLMLKVNELSVNARNIQSKLNNVELAIKTTEKIIEQTRFRLIEFDNLRKEQKELTTKYDDIDIIKEALSSNKGIPLLFIELYLKNMKTRVNELLDVIYKGDLEILDFIINEKEFRMPYVKHGMTVSDVSLCSQGERSFISMALSFALIENSVKEYNIMLLDEIDSTLSTENRAKFISILESQLQSIFAEQAFLITHNDMFDNYPVDLIITSDYKIDNYKNVNILFKA